MKRFSVLVLSVLWAQLLWAQTADESARIDYEAAKMALAAGDSATALRQFESVMSTLGRVPDLLFYAAQAAQQSGDLPKARAYGKECLEKADDLFRQSADYQQLLKLMAKLKLEDMSEARVSALIGRWSAPSVSAGTVLYKSYLTPDLTTHVPGNCSASATSAAVPTTGTEDRIVSFEVKLRCRYDRPKKGS